MNPTRSVPPDGTSSQIERFDCSVTLPDWRLHVAHMARSERRDLGNVMDLAIDGAMKHLSRRLPEGRLEESETILAVRGSLWRMGTDLSVATPSSEQLIAGFIRKGELPRGSLAWEFLAILVAKSWAPWSVVCRDALRPPLVFRKGEPGERLPTMDRTLDCQGLPVLADQDGLKASPWTSGSPEDLEECAEPVFFCFLPRELYRVVQPKSHLGRVVWMTWAYRFVYERTFPRL